MEISREFSYCPQRKSWNKWSKPVFACMMAILGITAAAPAARSQQQQKEVSPPMELSRTVRPWEFLPITGTRAALFGNEAGGMEAWVYPLKIFREFHLHFLTEGRVLSGETLARTLTVRPESATILYAGDTFTVRETLFVRSRPRSIATSNSSGRRRSEPLTSIGAHRNTRFILGKSKENSLRLSVRPRRRIPSGSFRPIIPNPRAVPFALAPRKKAKRQNSSLSPPRWKAAPRRKKCTSI